MPKVIKSKFRAQYKTFGLTYSRCALDKKEVMDWIIAKMGTTSTPVEDYYAVQETHKPTPDDPPGLIMTHIHIWFCVAAKPNISNCKYFDMKGHHPNLGKKNRSWVFNYLKKQDKDPYTNIPQGYVGLAKLGLYEEAKQLFADQHPKEYIINLDRVQKHLRSLSRKPRPQNYFTFAPEQYARMDNLNWDRKQTSLHIMGSTALGKTEFAKAWLHKNGYTYLRVTHLDGLKKYQGEDFILFDDLSFLHLPRETQIHITEVKNASSIHCRHTTAEIPPGIGRIFLSNTTIFKQDPAIERRVTKFAPTIRFY